MFRHVPQISLLLLIAAMLQACAKIDRVELNKGSGSDFIDNETLPPTIPDDPKLSIQRQALLKSIWNNRRPQLMAWADTPSQYPQIIYDLQGGTSLIFDYSVRHNELAILDDLAKLYLLPLNHLQMVSTYAYYDPEASPSGYVWIAFNTPQRMWVDSQGMENVINSSQFAFALAHALNAFLKLPANARTPSMQSLITLAPPLLKEHYSRWIFGEPLFQVRGWGCSFGRYNHQAYLRRKLEMSFGDLQNHSYCNALFDSDMWIILGVTEWLAANRQDPVTVSLLENEKTLYRNYARMGARLISERWELRTVAQNELGKVFDVGVWREHPDHRYSGYTGATFPEDNSSGTPIVIVPPKSDQRASWDLSHSRRHVQVLASMRSHRDLLDITFPTARDLWLIANYFFRRVFNGSFEFPLFTNFFDGSNGWYRVNYSGRTGFGYRPFQMSVDAMSGGFCRWREFHPELTRVCESLWKLVESPSSAQITHRTQYFDECVMSNFQPQSCNVFNLNSSSALMDFAASYY